MRIGCTIALALLFAVAVDRPSAMGEPKPAKKAPKVVDVKVIVDSEAPGYEGVNALDGDPQTMWHTVFSRSELKHPHEIVVDLGAVYEISGFGYLARPGGGNGTIANFEFYVSDDPKDFGQPASKGTMGRVLTEYTVNLRPKRTGRYVRLVALSEVKGRPWTSIAELNIHAEGVRFKTVGTRKTANSTTHVSGKVPGPDDGTVDGAFELARQTLAFVEKAAPRPELKSQLAALEKKTKDAKAAGAFDEETLYAETRQLRRKIIFSHPLLNFDRLLINKRPPAAFPHQSDQYLGRHSGIGAGLVVLDNWKSEKPTETVLLDGQLPPGSVLHPDLSFDGRKIMFSYCDHTEPKAEMRRFFVYEIGVDGKGLRQLTGTPDDPFEGADDRATVLIEDFDACYLPDGGFAFVSTRNQGGVRCHHGGRYCPTYTLYRANGDGSDIRPMVFGEANEWDPSVLHDGRIIWTRWDYINRHDTIYQSLWTIRPDGTTTAHFYGNYSRNPCSIAEARAIPGSHKVVGTTTAHHSFTAGSIIVIDPHTGQDGEEPLERITPEVAFPETEGWPATTYATPYPLSEDLFLAAYSPERHAKQGGKQVKGAYLIQLIDTLGGRETVYRDEQMSCFAPTPIVARPMPPALPSTLADKRDRETGTFYVQNVYHSTQPIERGSVKSLRVMKVYPQPVQRVPDRSLALFELPKRILGTVPVNQDGSVAFRAPAGESLMFQLLDENGMAVMSMRTFVYLHPGESVTCTGCHEPRNATPMPVEMPEKIVYRELTPPVEPRYEGGLSFARTVQPVLDRHCIECHGLDKTEGDINLLGTIDPAPIKLGRVRASAAYNSLTLREGLVSVALRNKETVSSKPKDYFAHAGRLAKILLDGDENHQPLTGDDFQRVVDWLDVNAEFFGDYSWNKAEWQLPSPEGEKALRDFVRKRFGEELASQPYAALVNVSLPAESRVLKALLAAKAGGWGQIAENGFTHAKDPAYQELSRLVDASFIPLAKHDIAGTCGLDPCQCGGCWVRVAREERKKRIAMASSDGE
jgi:hydrazine synthase alpha subunit-like protein/F5/8 type C domain-containing protein